MNNEPLPADAEGLAALRQLEKTVKLPDDPANTLPVDASLGGSFVVTEGFFDPWLSASPPGNGDLFTMFRDPDKDLPTVQFTLALTPERCTFTDSYGGVITASWDGSLTRSFTASPFPPLGAYAASARMEGENRLVMDIHWLNGWFETILEFTGTENGMAVTARKLRLNASDNYLIYTAFAEKVKEN